MNQPPARLLEVMQFTGKRMDEIRTNFKDGVKITVMVRTPGYPDRDFLLTDDELPEVMHMLERHAMKAAQ